MKNTAALREMADRLQLLPRDDSVEFLAAGLVRAGHADADFAPIWAEQLRYTFTSLLETKYPDLQAANGDVLPIGTVPPESTEWEHFAVDFGGYADWIGDDGEVAPNSFITTRKIKGTVDNLAHEWDTTVFDLERFAATYSPKIPFDSMKAKAARRAHDATTNWVWLFGDSAKDMPGLANHPAIPVSFLPRNAGNTSALWRNKTNDEILGDIATIVRAIPGNTKRQWFTGTVWLGGNLVELLNDRRLGTTDSGFASLWELVKARYSGDDSGQGKVTFKILRECEAAMRTDPRPRLGTQSDTSAITGDFILAVAAGLSKDEACFIRSRPFTQRPPQEHKLKIYNMTISGIGGCKLAQPYAVARFDFGTT